MTARTRAHGALVSALVVAAVTVGGTALPASAADDYPTWDEVQAAKADADSAAAEADRIAGLLDSLEADAARLGDDAVQQAAAFAQAETAAADAATAVASLETRAAEAGERADVTARQAGAVAASLARAGDPVLDLWFSGGEAETLLTRIGSMSKVTESLAVLRGIAERDRALASSLASQASAAATERDRLADQARQRSETAAAAQSAADARLADLQTRSSTLYEQLASLRGTSVQVEQQFRVGQALADSFSGDAGGVSDSGGGGGGSPSGGGAGSAAPAPTPAPAPAPAPVSDLGSIPAGSGSLSPADARSYAAGQVSARGWSDSEYQCLVWLWTRESSWRWNAYNRSSGAYGIPQALPGSKMASAGADWQTSAATQINWGLGYISNRYGTPCGAWDHSERIGWY